MLNTIIKWPASANVVLWALIIGYCINGCSNHVDNGCYNEPIVKDR